MLDANGDNTVSDLVTNDYVNIYAITSNTAYADATIPVILQVYLEDYPAVTLDEHFDIAVAVECIQSWHVQPSAPSRQEYLMPDADYLAFDGFEYTASYCAPIYDLTVSYDGNTLPST